jgi:NADPH:quinone reductase-like Zn-dependent oxidoreductase/aryl carrier-like protein
VTQALSWGLGRVIALEHPNLACRRIDLGDPDSEEELLALVGELRLESGPDEMALRGSRRYVPRLVASAPPTGADEGAEGGEKLRPLRLPRSESYCLDISRSGQLDNLCYRAAPRSEPPPGAVEIAVAAAGLNFRDVLNAMGLYPGGPIPFGGECAGTVSAVGEGVSELRPGDEVLAVAPASFAAFAVTDAALVVPKPPAMDFEEAATIPITFLTAHYALNHLARLQAGERVLIHAGAGGVGLAAIQLAQGADAEIFATAGSPEKREFLTSVGVKHVLDSRSLAFADEILEITHGRGVDVVLNSLPGEFISRSLAVLAPYGRFLEIGRTDIYQNRQLGLLPFQNNLSYTAIDLEKVCRERPELLRSLFLELMERFENGMLRPLPHRVFEAPDCVAAFRHMARRRNIGKVVISMGTAREDAQPDPGALRPDATYLVTGGCGALGSLLAERLVERGARHLALLGRSAPSEEVAERLASLGESGASVRVFLADVTDPDALAAALDEIRKELPALRGVFHAAGCVDDGLLTQLDVARFRSVLAPKVDGAWNLHALTRHDPLDRFVLFSSVASLLGSPGQGNYAAANAFQDALARYRRARGRPATAINWGPWARAGMAARAGLERILSARGMEPMPAERALDGLEEVLERDLGQALVACIRWPRLLGALGPGRGGELLASLAEEWSDAAESGAAGDGANGAERILALPAEERLCALIELIQGQLATVMGMERSDLPPDEALTNLGMDSLMGLELKERLESSIGVTLGIEHLVEDPSIADIAGTALAELVPDGDATPSGAPATSGSLALPSADPPAQGRRQTRPDL